MMFLSIAIAINFAAEAPVSAQQRIEDAQNRLSIHVTLFSHKYSVKQKSFDGEYFYELQSVLLKLIGDAWIWQKNKLKIGMKQVQT